MNVIFAIFLIGCAWETVTAVSICFDHYGCFSLDSPWWSISRPFAVLPKSPEEINTRFLLYTRRETEETELLANKTGVLQLSDFDGKKPTKFIIHGLLSGGYADWVTKMKQELLKNDDCNVIVVDWKSGAQLPYMQAVANARLVGVQLAHMAKFLNTEAGQPFGNMHIIGHCLGAHVAGYTGKETNKIGRISALDPAAPYFDGGDAKVRLDKNDAAFVDVIHTDGSSGLLHLGFGMDNAVGHVDFYPNNGVQQPGCGDLGDRITGTLWNLVSINLIGATQVVACSHLRAIDIFIESISTSCSYVAFSCANWGLFNEGRCLRCDLGSCSRIGFHSNEFSGRGKMYLATNQRNPFCLYSHTVELITSRSQEPTNGKIFVQLIGRSGKSEVARVNNDGEHLTAKNTFVMTISSLFDIGDIQEVRVSYEDSSWIFHGRLVVHKIIASALDRHLGSNKFNFCAHEIQVSHGKTVSFQLDESC